jgi:hypothetical protein
MYGPPLDRKHKFEMGSVTQVQEIPVPYLTCPQVFAVGRSEILLLRRSNQF